MKICFLCSKGQKFNVLDFDENWFATQFLSVNSIFEVFMMKSFQKNEKIEFCHFCISLVLYSISETLDGRGTLNFKVGSKIQVPFFKLVKSMKHIT